jgi:hypothetical protein
MTHPCCPHLRKALELIAIHAKACIYTTEEECDISANWVLRRCEQALAETPGGGCECGTDIGYCEKHKHGWIVSVTQPRGLIDPKGDK